MSVRCANAALLSIWAKTRVWEFASCRYSIIDSPSVRPAHALPKLRCPSGGNLAAATTASASARELIIGAMMPHAPASSARLMFSTFPCATRTIGAPPASAMAATICVIVSASIGPCSASTASQSQGMRASRRTAAVPGKLNQRPRHGWPSSNRCLSVFGHMR